MTLCSSMVHFPSTAVKSDTGRYGASQGRSCLGGTSRLRQSRPNPPMGMPADRLLPFCRFSGFLPLPCHSEADRKHLFLKAGSVFSANQAVGKKGDICRNCRPLLVVIPYSLRFLICYRAVLANIHSYGMLRYPAEAAKSPVRCWK